MDREGNLSTKGGLNTVIYDREDEFASESEVTMSRLVKLK